MFTSLEEVKAVAEKFKAGKIVPRRVLACTPKNKSHLVIFLCDTYRIRSSEGYDVFLCDFNQTINTRGRTLTYGPIHVKKANIKALNLQGAVYGKRGNVFRGNVGVKDSELLHWMNSAIFDKTRGCA